MNQPPLIDLEITDLARGGAGVARTSEGQVVFVPYTAPGDLVRVRLHRPTGRAGKKTESTFLRGTLIEVLRASPERVKPPCAVFGRCGGCDWQHLPYELQWKTKVSGVGQALRRAQLPAELLQTLDTFPAEAAFGYRNRVQVHGDLQKKPVVVGFHAKQSNTIIDTEQCEIARPEINTELRRVREQIRGRLFHAEKPFKLELDFDPLRPTEGVRRFLNAPHASGGFRQVNDAQNERLKQWVLQQTRGARLVLDLYGGSGNLSTLHLAATSPPPAIFCVDVGAPESSPDGTRQFVRQSARAWLDTQTEILAPEAKPDTRVALIDPPRAGVADDFEAIATGLRRQNITTLVTVGCDVDAWSRDLRRWIQDGWTVQRVALFDFFPQTPHLESAAVLTHRL